MRATKSILLSILSIPLVLSEPIKLPSAADTIDFDFQELLAVLPADSLHVALHKHVDEKFQDGVYEHERLAVQKVHNEDPSTATKVLAEAALHLLKRQASDNTTVTEPTTTTTTETSTTEVSSTPADETSSSPTTEPSSTSTAAPATTVSTTTKQSDVVVPVEVSTTDSQGQATTITTSAVASPTVSVTQEITTTNSKGSTVVQTTTAPAAVVTQDGVVTTSPVSVFVASTANTKPTDVTTTDTAGQTVVLASVTPGKIVTATNANGGVFVTTYTPGGGTVSSLVLMTTQLPNGQLTTITSFAVVAADTAASPSSTNAPKIQSGADSFRSSRLVMEAIVLVCSAISAALFL
jgi:hypothetical protein